jgi:Leucine rich repeat
MDHLTTIPEDVSVAASADANNPGAPRSIANLSTASAVASSDSGEYASAAETTTSVGRGLGGRVGKKRRQHGSGLSTNAAVGGVVGGGDGDNVSDTHASLGGAEAAAAAAAVAAEGAVSRDAQRRIEESRKPLRSSADLSWLLKCTKKSMVFYCILSVLLIVVAVGIYFIVVNVGGSSNSIPNGSDQDISTQLPDDEPTPDPQFPVFEFMESEFPTISPSYNQADVVATDLSLLQVDGTTETNLYDTSTPEGMSRYWLIHIDQQQLRVDVVGEARVQQRYIACVLYYATNGANWTGTTSYLNPTLHECDWDGVTCRGSNIALIELSEKNLSGTIPQELKSLSSLEALDLCGNSIAGTIPDGLFDSLVQLAWLDLSQNMIGGRIPELQASASPVIETVLLSGNQLEGVVPFFPNIQKIKVEENKLTSIDTRYATSAQSLKEFVGYNNQFSGPLPSVWNASNLELLDVGLNKWTGPIPQGLWDLTSLRSLIIDSCELTGPLPSSTGGTAFEHVWLQSNLLDGTIPATFGTNWVQLNSLLLQDNQLIGSITDDHCDKWPASAPGQNGTPDDWRCETDCNKPAMTCSCCTECYPTISNRTRR